MRQFMTLLEDGFHSKSAIGAGFVGLSYETLWEAVAEDAIPGEPTMHKTLAEALKDGPVVMEFDKSKFVMESVSLQPALTAIHADRRTLNRFLEERELDAIFLKESERQQTEMMAWFLRTSAMVKDL